MGIETSVTLLTSVIRMSSFLVPEPAVLACKDGVMRGEDGDTMADPDPARGVMLDKITAWSSGATSPREAAAALAEEGIEDPAGAAPVFTLALALGMADVSGRVKVTV